jgi:hypothetical protein
VTPGTTSGNRSPRRRRALQGLCAGAALALLAALLSVQTGFAGAADAPATSAAPSRPSSLDRGIEDRILALDPLHISAAEVRDVLKHAPAPRIIGIQGSFPRSRWNRSRNTHRDGISEERLRDPRMQHVAQQLHGSEQLAASWPGITNPKA